MRDASHALAAYALPGGYASPHNHQQITSTYGPSTPRLLAAGAPYDPASTFTAIPLPTRLSVERVSAQPYHAG